MASRSTSGPPRDSALPDVFAACVAHFELIQRDQCSDPDHRFAETWLNNLEARFTAWGRACGLDEAVSYNGALDVLETGPRVLDTLTCMIDLFRQAKRYGLTPFDQAATPATSGADGMTWRRIFPTLKWPRLLREGAASPPSDTLSKIQDPDKFERLIKRLKCLIEDLEFLTKELDISRRQRQFVIDGIESLSDIATLERIEMARLNGEDTVSDAASIRLRHIRAVKGSDQGSVSVMSKHETFFSALSQQSADRPVPTSTSLLTGFTETVAALDLEPQNKRLVADLFHESRPADQAVAIDASNLGKMIAQTRAADCDAVQRLPTGLRRFTDIAKRNPYSAQKIVYVHLVKIVQKGPDFVSIAPAEDSLLDLIGSFEGPPSSPYEGGIFHISMKIPTDYPFVPPKCRFITRVYHPNIDATGKICLDILDDCSAWSSYIFIDVVLISIMSILDSPNVEDPLVPEIAEVYMKDRQQYNDNAAMYTRKYAMHDDCKLCQELGAKRRSVPVHGSYWMSKNLHALAYRSVNECLETLCIDCTTHAVLSQASSSQSSPQRASSRLSPKQAAMQAIQMLAEPLLRNKAAIESMKRVFDDIKASKGSNIGDLSRIDSALERSRSATHSISKTTILESWNCQICREDSTTACSGHQVCESESNPISFATRTVKELETSTEDLESQLEK